MTKSEWKRIKTNHKKKHLNFKEKLACEHNVRRLTNDVELELTQRTERDKSINGADYQTQELINMPQVVTAIPPVQIAKSMSSSIDNENQSSSSCIVQELPP